MSTRSNMNTKNLAAFAWASAGSDMRETRDYLDRDAADAQVELCAKDMRDAAAVYHGRASYIGTAEARIWNWINSVHEWNPDTVSDYVEFGTEDLDRFTTSEKAEEIIASSAQRAFVQGAMRAGY